QYCTSTSSHAPRRYRKPQYAVQQRRKTCWPLSYQRPSCSKDHVAPPSRGRRSTNVTSPPRSAASIAALSPARPPPITTIRGALTLDLSRWPVRQLEVSVVSTMTFDLRVRPEVAFLFGRAIADRCRTSRRHTLCCADRV